MTENRLPDELDSAIAIVGMSCRVPGANTVAEFWDNIQKGDVALRQLSDAELLAAGVPEAQLKNPAYVKATMALDEPRGFDAAFFGFSPRDAGILDPQHRHFLEMCWEALEDGGVNPYAYEGSIGVFGGSGHNSYMPYNLLSNPELEDEVGFFLLRHTGNDKDFLTTRVSYNFNLRGPSLNIQTACSTSLVAIHTANQSLLSGECDLALAGAITINLPLEHGYVHEEGGILSRDGNCRPFDAESTGTILSSGGGVILLKRLEDAIDDRDEIHAVIIGSAVNNDGFNKVNYLAPSVDGQSAAISEAIEIAEIERDSVGFIECHGTGTKIGDPIEIAALTQAYGRNNARKQYCAVGSVKSNIGHTDTAAGVLGVIKSVMSIKSAKIAPTAHFKSANLEIDFESSPFYVNDQLRDWPSDGPRRAGISSLGVGGTNAHVILEQAPQVESEAPNRPWNILALSAKSSKALGDQMLRMKDHLARNPDENMTNCEFTLLRGRQAMEHRRFAVVRDARDAMDVLDDLKSDRWVGAKAPDVGPSGIVFMYAGGGAQYPGMGRDLFESQPVFRAALEECARELKPWVDFDLLDLMFPSPENLEAATLEMEKPSRSLPCLFSMQYAQSMLWLSLGVKPEALIGHSMGENTALCVSGAITLKEGLSFVATRGRLQDTAPAGGMLSVMATAKDLAARLTGELSIGVINGPEMCVVSGPVDQLNALQEKLDKDDVQCARVRINVAAHSPMLDPILPEFKRHLETLNFQAPKIPIASTYSGTWLTDEQATSADYWVEQLRNTVKFSDAAQLLLSSKSDRVFLEVGPANVLTSLMKQQPGAQGRVVVPSSRHRKDVVDDNAFLLSAAANLWMADADIDWDQFYGDMPVGRISLPTYPFEHRDHWVKPGKRISGELISKGAPSPPDDWFYQPNWTSAAVPVMDQNAPSGAGVLVFSQDPSVAQTISTSLESLGYSVEIAAIQDDADKLRDVLSSAAARYPQGLAVVYLGGLSPSSMTKDGLDKSFYPFWTLARELIETEVQAARLAVVSSSSLQYSPGEAVPGSIAATTLGMLRTLPKEMPTLSVRYVDVDLDVQKSEAIMDATLKMVAVDVLDGFSSEVEQQAKTLDEDYEKVAVTCYRRGQRFEECFASVRRQSIPQTRLENFNGGHVVVTGGLGGLGLQAAAFLASRGCSHISLIGRSALPARSEWPGYRSHDSAIARRIKAIESLEASGVDINVLVADVADPASLNTAIASARETGGKITGLIHAAGTLDDRLLQLKTKDEAEAVLAPKVLGAINLVEATRTDPVDFVVFYSSVSAYMGAQGQTDYSAANAFLDSYARDLAANGVAAISINWSIWQDVGMAADLAEGRKAQGAGFVSFAPRLRDNVYEECLSTVDWILNEHRTKAGLAIVPGTALIQLVHSAASQKMQALGAKHLRIEDMSLFAPLSVKDGTQVVAGVKLLTDGAATDFEILSAVSPLAARSDDWENEHVQGRVSLSDASGPDTVDLAALKSRLKNEPDVAAAGLTSPFMEFGDRWACLKGYWSGETELFAELEVNERYLEDFKRYPLHPALLDNAIAGLQSIQHHAAHPGEFLIPMSFETIDVFKPLPSKIFSHVKFLDSVESDRREFDINIYDASGVPLIAVHRFSMKIGESSTLDAAVNKPEAGGTYLDFSGGISPAEGDAVLGELIGNSVYSQIVVSPMNFHAIYRQSKLVEKPPAIDSTQADEHELSNDYVAPETPFQKTLAEIWQKGLGIDRVGISDNFFQLGGHSLLLTQLASRMKKELKVNPKVSLLFESPTIAAWSKISQESGDAPAVDKPRPIKRVSRESYRATDS